MIDIYFILRKSQNRVNVKLINNKKTEKKLTFS